MPQDPGEAHRRVSTGVNGAAPSVAGVGQWWSAGAAARSAASMDAGPVGAPGVAIGRMVDGTGAGASPVPGELPVPGPAGCEVAASDTGVAAGGGTASGTPGAESGSAGLLMPPPFLRCGRCSPASSVLRHRHFFSGSG